MKYLSALLFILLLRWSWNAAYSDRPIQLETHTLIQAELAEIIEDVVSKNMPQAENLYFHKLWTENVSKDQIRATFKYSFEDPVDGDTVEQTVEGFAMLKRISTEGADENSWSLEKVQVQGDVIEFKKGLLIAPDSQ